MEELDIAIVGAGAAGLATAIFLRRATRARSIELFDGAKKPGAKILVSGGSRCNVTNAVVDERDFYGGRSSIVRRVLRAFPVADTIDFFRSIGISLHEEANGKLFPDSNRSRDVLDALMREAARLGVSLRAGHRVLDVDAHADGFHIVTERGRLRANAVVLATGGASLPKTGSDGAGFAIAKSLGHTIVPTTPALAPLLLGEPSIHKMLSGVAQDVQLTIWTDGAAAIRLNGALLWTHFGVSGPAAMNGSRHWLRARLEGREVSMTVNFRRGDGFERVDAEWQRLALESPKGSVRSILATMVPASVAAALLAQLAIDDRTPLAHLGREDRRRLARALVEWPLPVVDSRGYNFAEATAGGVELTEIDPSTMSSRVCPGLYCVGEILDVDGRIGGFNFQWAWSSGFVAGRALAGTRG